MGRLRLKVEGRLLYKCELEVRSTDLNYGNHLGNDSLVSMLQQCRILWLRSLGYPSELNVDGNGLIQVDLQVQYIKEAFLGELLSFELYLAEMDVHRIELCYKVSKGSLLCAIAFTNLLNYSYQSKKIIPFPDSFNVQSISV